jgi:hypothetical protein
MPIVGPLEEAIEPLAEIAGFVISHALTPSLLDAQVGEVVVKVLELPFEFGSFAGAEPGRA